MRVSRSPKRSGREVFELLSGLTIIANQGEDVINVTTKACTHLKVDLRGLHKFIVNQASTVLNVTQEPYTIRQAYNPIPARVLAEDMTKWNEVGKSDGTCFEKDRARGSILDLAEDLSRKLTNRRDLLGKNHAFHLLTSLVLALIEPERSLAPFTPYISRYIANPLYAAEVQSQTRSIWALAIMHLAKMVQSKTTDEDMQKIGVEMYNKYLRHQLRSDTLIPEPETIADHVRIALCIAGFSSGVFQLEVVHDTYKPEDSLDALEVKIKKWVRNLRSQGNGVNLLLSHSRVMTSDATMRRDRRKLPLESICKLDELSALEKSIREPLPGGLGPWFSEEKTAWRLALENLNSQDRLLFELNRLEDLSFWGQSLSGADVRTHFNRNCLHIDDDRFIYQDYLIEPYLKLLYPPNSPLPIDSYCLMRFVKERSQNERLKVAIAQKLHRSAIVGMESDLTFVMRKDPTFVPIKRPNTTPVEKSSQPGCEPLSMQAYLDGCPPGCAREAELLDLFAYPLNEFAHKQQRIGGDSSLLSEEILSMVKTVNAKTFAMIEELTKMSHSTGALIMAQVRKIYLSIAYSDFLKHRLPNLKSELIRDSNDNSELSEIWEGEYKITSHARNVITIEKSDP